MQEDKIVQLGVSGRILELGCYNGYLEIELAEKGSIYAVGVDLNPFNLGSAAKTENLLDPKFLTCTSINARKILQVKLRVDFVLSDARFLPFKDRVFDLVICSQLLEHMQNIEEMLLETKRVLKVDGKLFVSVPNRFCFKETHNAPPFLHWLPYKFWLKLVYPHVWKTKDNKRRPTWFVHRFYTRFLLRNQLISSGFKIDSLQEAQYVPSKLYASTNRKRIRKTLLIINETLEKVPLLKHLGSAIIAIASRIE
jgi:ubiquinone/menaquinone biosynthesis C-methylase UbiE